VLSAHVHRTTKEIPTETVSSTHASRILVEKTPSARRVEDRPSANARVDFLVTRSFGAMTTRADRPRVEQTLTVQQTEVAPSASAGLTMKVIRLSTAG